MTAPLLRWTTSALFFAAVVSILTILMACGGESPDAAQDRAPRESVPSTEAADPTPEPTATPEPTPMAEPTATPEPTPTIEPMATPEPSPTMAPTPSPDLTDRDILELFYHATGGPNWANNENWLSDNPLGEWYGVTTDADGRVTELDFMDEEAAGRFLSALEEASNRLTGEIPPEIDGLSRLRSLDLRFNQIGGELPEELGNIPSLEQMVIRNNQLQGEIPAELSNLSQLKTLSLGSNQLTGDIPPELSNLSQLETLSVGRNQLTGEIPPGIGNLSGLKFLDLGSNRLTGGIPVELTHLTNLESLFLYWNGLEGPLPPQLGLLPKLTSLSLEGNRLSGEIPDSLANLVNLTRFALSGNQFTGNIPAWLGNFTELRHISLSGNQLTGGLPKELGSLNKLQSFYIHGNRLTGEIPKEWGNMSRLRAFKINGNSISGCLPTKWLGQVDPEYGSTDLAGLPFCSADQASTTDPGSTPTPPERPAPTSAFNLTTLIGPAPLPNLGDENGNVPLDALERHRWIYESGYYQSLLEKANFDSPTPLTSRGHRIVIEHVCGHGDISPCVLLRDFFAPNLLERTEGQVNFQVVTYREARANASRILAALLDGGVDSATIYSWVLPEGRIQFLLGLYQSSELEFQATQAIMPDLEQAHATASGGTTFSRSWSPGGDYYLFCGDRIESPEDLKGKLIHGRSDWVEGMGATHRQLVSGTGEMFAALNEGNVDCIATTAGTGHDNHFWAAARYMGGPLVSFNFLHNVVSGQKWNSIPSDLQQIFLEEAAKSELEELRLASVLDERGLNALRGRNLEPVPLSPSLLDHSFNIAAKDYVIPAWVELVGDPNDPIITDTFNNKIGPIVGLLINPDGTVSPR